MFIKRLIEPQIKARWDDRRAILIYGARRTGKTTLLKRLTDGLENVHWFNADNMEVQNLFTEASESRFRLFLPRQGTVVIDEAQNIHDIGIKLKIIIDQFPNIRLLVSGSSSFDLSNKINEPLTGRKWEFLLFPFSFEEMAGFHGVFTEHNHLAQRLIYGYYPEVVLNPDRKIDILRELTESYLFKDVLIWSRIRKSDKIVRLLQALAFQVGQLVSYNELGQIVGLHRETVENYIDLLEQAFVLFRLTPYGQNLRNELKKARKIYFYDNGIRNALINNFNPLELRNDTGALWENFLISERIKFIHNHRLNVKRYFWRIKQGSEIDYIETSGGRLWAYEFKFGTRKKTKIPPVFAKAYPRASFKAITPEPEKYIPFVSQYDTQTNNKGN